MGFVEKLYSLSNKVAIVTGSSGSESYERISAPCGQTKTYCLGVDGTNIVGVAVGSDSTVYQLTSGTSYAAPQVTGAVALLKEAFPNHTAEMIVDRLLATGQNSTSLIGAHDAAVTFGNGATVVNTSSSLLTITEAERAKFYIIFR